MGRLSTHVLDIVTGGPAKGVPWVLYSIKGNVRSELSAGRTNSDGRTDGAILEGAAVIVGQYELIFNVAGYFKAMGTHISEPPFLDEIPLRFSIFDSAQNYHVPLLVSPYSYSTYRGN